MKTKKRLSALLAMLILATVLPCGNVMAKETNLVAGLPYTVTTGVGIEYSYKLQGTESDPSAGLLTDGKKASDNSYSDPAWHKFYRGLSRTVEFQLPKTQAITGLYISTIQCNEAGVMLAPFYELFVSENGKDWMKAGAYDAREMQTDKGFFRRNLRVDFDERYKAKYVRLTFCVSVNAFLDEIEVYGTDVDGSEAPFVKTEEPTYADGYNMGLDGCKDIVLLYCGYQGDLALSQVQNTTEEMLYYFGYVDKDGNIKDTFFDSFQFSPLRGAAPSGGNLNQSGNKQTVKSDWEYYLDSVFDEQYNCGAIEQAMEQVKTATGKTDATVSMVLTIPFPTIGNKPFGDIDGDGTDEYCRNTEDQLAIYEWFFDQVETRLAERNYQNIRFAGYYWEQEGLEMNEDEYSLVRSVADRVHARDAKFFWIPFLYGNGFDMLDELGFDSAVMQPNYAFLDYAQENCLTEIDAELQKYGLGMEIEIHWNAPTDNDLLARYYGYLNGGSALGYMHAANAYYQNADPGTYYHMAKSPNVKLRNIYDDTYAYVKGTYKVRTVTLNAKKQMGLVGETVRGTVRVASGCIAETLGRAEWVITTPPKNGKAEIGEDGRYSYVPNDSFEGMDSFTVQLVAPYASSEPVEVSVQIGELSGDISAPNESVSEPTEPPVTTQKKPILPWILGGACVLAAIAATAAILVKRKKS